MEKSGIGLLSKFLAETLHFDGPRDGFEKEFTLGKKLGQGAFSVVNEVKSNESGELFAAKVVTKEKLSKADEIGLRDEIEILKTLNHQHIIKLYNVFEEKRHWYLITELMPGGDLFDRIVTKTFYTESEARDTLKIIFSAMDYVHKQNFAHRDLKPDNILLLSKEDDKDIKIADFGFAKKSKEPQGLVTQCGTPEYVSPEILCKVPYGTKCDMWSLGVIMYIMLGGYPPFKARNQIRLFKKIKRGQYQFHEQFWGHISEEAKELIAGMLTVDQDRRLSASQVLDNSWFQTLLPSTENTNLNLDKFRKYNAKRKVRQAVFALIATNKITSLGIVYRTNNASHVWEGKDH